MAPRITNTLRLSGEAETMEDAVSTIPSGVPTEYRVTVDVVFELRDGDGNG